MTKISTFSNGHTDTYNGKRDVKAGWMITGPEGDFYTGHSQDAETARKTAESKAVFLNGAPSHVQKPTRAANPAWIGYHLKLAKEAGFNSHKAHYDAFQTQMATFRSRCRIEVVPV